MEIRAKVYRVVAIQAALAVAICLAIQVLAGPAAAGGAAIGGGIAVLGSWHFARWVVRYAGVDPQRFMRAFYVGEVMKIVLTAALFWVAIALLDAAPGPLFATYAATLMVYWLALLPVVSGDAPQRQ